MKLRTFTLWLSGAALLATLSGCNIIVHDSLWRDGYIPPYPKQPETPVVAMPSSGVSSSPEPDVAFIPQPPNLPGWKEDQDKKNPSPGDAASIARGKDAFTTNCAVCHGPDGKGDGPNATLLPLRPRNLTQGVFEFGGDDWQVYRTISEGIPGSPMVAWKSILTDDKSLWDVVNYVKSLHHQ
ncbi:MAG TPA: cytochrome c [Candidatus Xenobia bacterium]